MIYAVNNTTKEHRVITGEAREVDDWRNKMQGWHVVKADADGWIEWSGHADNPLPEHSAVSYHDGGADCRSIAQLAPWSHIIAYRPTIDQPTSEGPKGWDGVGLPPVGMVCEFINIDDSHPVKSGTQVSILCHYEASPSHFPDEMVAVFSYKCDALENRNVSQAIEDAFRPIRTDRERWIEAAMQAADTNDRAPLIKQYFEAIYDAGLAKLPEKTQ